MRAATASRGPDYVAVGAVLLMALIWGFNWVAIKLIAPDVSPFLLSAIRMAIATTVLFGALVLLRRPLRSTPARETFVAGMLQNGIFVVLQTIAILTGTVGKTAVLVYTMPLWVVLMAPLALGERITRPRGIALVLGILGIVALIAPMDLQHALVSKGLALLMSVLWAAGVVYTKRIRSRLSFDTLTFTAWQMCYTLPVLALAALIAPGAFFHPTAWTFYPLLASVAIGGTAIAFLLFMFVVARLSAGTAGLSSLLVPVVSLLAAALVIGERPTPLELTGTALILCGLAVNSAPQLLEIRRHAKAA